MSATSDLVTGMAQILATAGIVTYRADGTAYTASETGVYFNDQPPDPDQVVVITSYATSNDQPVITLGSRRVQIRTRGVPGDALGPDALADAIFEVLHGASDLTMGAIHVVQILRVSSLSLGMDMPQRRWMRSDNYEVDLDYATTALRPI